jgi:8-oxo-dGTP pyrophosphatase MutT (NUDIX family)
MRRDLTEKIQTALTMRRPKEIENELLIHASVLIPICETAAGYEVLFTERTHRVEHHKGQISFPGGAVEESDRDYQETALREAYEEIGLAPDDVQVLGRLDDELTVASNFIVHPFVGKFSYPYEFVINQHEVERIIPVPLELFFHENAHLHPAFIDFKTFVYNGPVYRYEEITIWGATAKIMHKFMGLIGGNLSLPEKP